MLTFEFEIHFIVFTIQLAIWFVKTFYVLIVTITLFPNFGKI